LPSLSAEQVRERAVARCHERGILIPTFAQMRDPGTIDPAVAAALKTVDMEAIDPLNLFRITWRNDPAGGGFGEARSAPPSAAWCRG